MWEARKGRCEQFGAGLAPSKRFQDRLSRLWGDRSLAVACSSSPVLSLGDLAQQQEDS